MGSTGNEVLSFINDKEIERSFSLPTMVQDDYKLFLRPSVGDDRFIHPELV